MAARKKGNRNAQGSGTIRKYNDDLWQARVTIGRNPATGKQVQKSIYGHSQKEVRQKLTALLADLDNGTYIAPNKMTVSQWLDLWVKDYTVSIKENTLVSYRIQIDNHIKPALGAVILPSLAPHQVQSFYNSLSADLNAKTIKNVHGVLHMAMKQAVLNKYIKYNPCDAVQLPKIHRKEILPLDESQLNKFLVTIKGSNYELMFKIDLFTGLRQGELMGLTWNRIDFDKGIITVDRQLMHEKKKNGRYKFASTKTENIRKIKPAPIVMNWLKEQKRQQSENRLKAGKLWYKCKKEDKDTVYDLDGLVFTDEFGNNKSCTTLSHAAKRFAEKSGVTGFRFHDMRHTYAVLSIRAGDDIKTISYNLGHSNITTTLNIYAHYTEDMRNDSSDRMTEYMSRFGNL